MNKRTSSNLSKTIIYTILIVFGLMSLFPFFWMLRASFMTSESIFATPIIWIPDTWHLENFGLALTSIPFFLYLKNTLIIVGLNMIGSIFSSSICGFGFARIKFPGRDIIFLMVLATMMIPGTVLLIPQFFLYTKLGLYNTFVPLYIQSFFINAFFIFMFRQFLMTLPMDYDEAAFMDGANYPTIYAKIIMPMCKPVIATVGVFSFMWTWNDFFTPLIYLQDDRKYTLALGILSFKSHYNSQWNYLMAVSTIITLPMIIVYFFCQRYFVEGISFSGVKG